MEDANIGRILQGKYELLRVIGTGGMGAVYEAQHLLIKRRLAVKLLHQEYAKQEWTMQRFKQEAIAATSIGHDHIVDITDMGITRQGEIFIVMEYLDGIDLAALLRREQRLSIQRSCHIVIQILSALEAAHSKGIIHRDLKPANIFLIESSHSEDYVKLVDFGISKMKQKKTEDHILTRTGELLGTPSFMSPEQAVGKVDITPHADIFSVGVILYNLLTGELPFTGAALTIVLMKIMNDEPTDIAELRPETPPDLIAAVKKALAKTPEDRFKDAAAFRRALLPFSPETPSLTGLKSTHAQVRLSALAEAIRENQTSAPYETPPLDMVTTVTKRSRTRFSLIGLGVGLAVIIGLGIFFVRGYAPVEEKGEDAPIVHLAPPKAAAEMSSKAASSKEETVTESAEETIALHINATPENAAIFLDGFLLGRGTVKKRFPKGASFHEVRVQAPGYSEFHKSVTFDEAVNVTIVLGRTNAKQPPQQPLNNKKGNKPPAASHPQNTAPSGDDGVKSAPETSAAEPEPPEGDPSPKAPRGDPGAALRPIDEEAPW